MDEDPVYAIKFSQPHMLNILVAISDSHVTVVSPCFSSNEGEMGLSSYGSNM